MYISVENPVMQSKQRIGIEHIQSIKFDKFEEDFSFIVNEEIYKTNSFVAIILSPNVSKLFEENKNVSYYEIKTKYEGDFNKIIKYGEMKFVDIQEEEKKYFEDVLKQLGNNVEFIRFSKDFQEPISYQNVINRLEIKKELDVNLDEEITFISSNFHDFITTSPDSIFTFDIDIIEQIISNDKLKLYNEEELFNIILELYSKSKEYSLLFSYVIFLNLTSESIRKFNQNFDINDMNISIWENICHRLEQDISSKSKETYLKSNQEFLKNRYDINDEISKNPLTTDDQQNNNKRYEKIIQHLSEQCHGNVHLKNIVTITCSSKSDGDVQNIVDQNDNTSFSSDGVSNSWIQLDFKERKVLLDGYTLKTWGQDGGHLRNWVLEVSNDGLTYTEIDRHKKCPILNGPLNTATFKVSCSTPQRFVRLKQIGSNTNGYSYLNLNQIEFSGSLNN